MSSLRGPSGEETRLKSKGFHCGFQSGLSTPPDTRHYFHCGSLRWQLTTYTMRDTVNGTCSNIWGQKWYFCLSIRLLSLSMLCHYSSLGYSDSSTSCMFPTCMTFFLLWSIKEDILRNVSFGFVPIQWKSQGSNVVSLSIFFKISCFLCSV